MTRSPILVATLSFFCLPGVALQAEADGRIPSEPISLAGPWRCALDGDDAGIDQRWFQREIEGQASLPGSLTENGLGDDVSVDTAWTGQIVDRSWFADPKYEPYRQPGNVKVPFWLTPLKHYVGPAWYQRHLTVPDAWKGKHTWLRLERVHIESRVWIDDREVGMRNSLSTPHEYDLGVLSPGEHRLTIRIDNRVKIDVGRNAHSVSDHTQTNWNGVVGRIELFPRGPVWIDELRVSPLPSQGMVGVHVEVSSLLDRAYEGRLVASVHRDGETIARQEVEHKPTGRQNTTSHRFAIRHSRLRRAARWGEFSPELHELTVDLEVADGRSTHGDRRTATFGMREVGTDGTQITINGRSVFLRGTLECAIFPLTGYPPIDVESWTRILSAAKAHGLNHVRFHSWCPPEAAFVAADRMGVIFQVECGVWTRVGSDPEIDAFIEAETERILRAYGNHPSFCLLSHGNEPGGGKAANAFLARWLQRWKKTDPRRLYTAGSGWPELPESQFHVTPKPRIQAWGAGLSSRVNARPPETVTDYRDFVQKYPTQPVISHEIGQWCVYPNLAEVAKYTGVTRACNFEIFRDTLRANHMLDQAHDFLIASGKLQALLYKEEIESALRTPGFGGFQLLDLHDFPGQGTALVGVLDPFWESKGYITPEQFRRFCCETVPLARMEKRVFTAAEDFAAQVEIAHYGPGPLEEARIAWRIVGQDGQPVASGELPRRTIPRGLTELGEVRLALASVPAPQKLVLAVGIVGAEYENDWDFWVYPAEAKTARAEGVTVVDALDAQALAALRSGGRVLLLPKRGSVKGDERGRIPPGFSSIFWNTAWTRRQAPHTLGILCDPGHPALAAFPTDFHSNWQWWDLVRSAQIMILDRMPPELRPIVQVIDDWFTNRRLGLVLEAEVEGGKLLVCGIDLTTDLDKRPVARQMRASLLKYMAGESFRPRVTLPAKQVQDLFSPPPAVQQLGAKVRNVSSQAHGYEGAKAIDGDPATSWHTQYEPEVAQYPHEIEIDLGRSIALKGFRVLPRQDMQNGWIARYEVYVSEDGKAWDAPVAKGRFPAGKDAQEIPFQGPAKGRFVRLVAVEGYRKQPWAAVAELDVLPAEPAE